SLEALRELATPSATVLRDGEATEVLETEIVPGDVVLLEAGDVVPADARILDATELAVDEAALTGESLPVSKGPAAVSAGTVLAERTSMVYKGTSVARGRATAVVAATGMESELGRIATSLEATGETATPLQVELDVLGRRLGLGVLALSVAVAALLLLEGTDAVQAALTAISLAVAAVPEGLPAVVTLTLALGVRTMSAERALVRHLPAVEGLGSIDVICTDKTGTLTRGEMTVERLWVPTEAIEAGMADLEDSRVDALARTVALCNDATDIDGDPTERALVEVAERLGLDVASLRERHPRTAEVPFSSEEKWMGTVHGEAGGHVKGAPGVVFDRCSRVCTADGVEPMTPTRRRHIETAVEAFGEDALRVLAVAQAPEAECPDDLHDELTFVGLAGMLDPPREEVRQAIAATRGAGIEVKMITGDNARTAVAIAEAVGIKAHVLEGRELEAMDDEGLRERVGDTSVFARATPEHKLRILDALQANGHVVAMTGDGVNDAPAIKNADVGVAMGIRGTEVAREASDIVLLDDNYATIARAIERGRAVFDNIWKFVAYLLSANVAEVAIVVIASLFGYLILPAVQLLWINLLTDGLPALAIGVDPESGDVMAHPPRSADAGIIGHQMLALIGGLGAVTTAVMLGLMFVALGGAETTTAYAMTVVFTAFVVAEFEKLFVIRWVRETPTWSNRFLGVAIGASLAAHLAILYTPLSTYFGTVALGVEGWGLIAVALLVCLPGHLVVAILARRLPTASTAA
ncbi:MAG: cation-translocating P-type ATPase, partial [Halobacteriota archaeon]